MAKRWSKREENQLLQGAGVYGLSWFQRNTESAHSWPNAPKGRSYKALYCKARRLFGRGGFSKGSYSLSKACRVTGYSRTQLRRAQAALGQKWKRLSPTGSYLIFEEQLEELSDWLGKDYWYRKGRLYCCSWCHTEERPHRSQGLCSKCYPKYVARLRRAGAPLPAVALLAFLEASGDNGPVVQVAKTALEKKIAIPERELLTLIRLWREHARAIRDGRVGLRVVDTSLECREVAK